MGAAVDDDTLSCTYLGQKKVDVFLFAQGWLPYVRQEHLTVGAIVMIVWKCTCGKDYVCGKNVSSTSLKHPSYRWGISHKSHLPKVEDC